MDNIAGFIFLCGLVLVSATQPQDEILNNFQQVTKLSHLGLEFADFFQNVTLSDISLADSRAPNEEDLLCLRDLTLFSNALKERKLWALKMIDAWGSIPSGILTGNRHNLGNYDECLNINKDISQGVTIRGKYCFLQTSLSAMLGSDIGALGVVTRIKTATCFPASCSAAHMNLFVSQVLQKVLNLDIPSTAMGISDASCQTSASEPWDGLTIFTVVLLSLMGAIVAVFTVYDYFFCKNHNELPAIVKAFSARANSRALFRIVENTSNPNVISCLNGIRCMSLFWVVFSHEYTGRFFAANLNLFNVLPWSKLPFASFILHGFFSVDSFFFLGGLLLALIALRTMDRTKGKLNVPLMYLHRLIRIVPILAVAILVYTKLMTVVANGPLLQGFSGETACETGWYWTLLFVNNYTNVKCLGHTWYLSVDMQLFIISPVLLIALYKWGKKAAAGIFVLIVLLSGCLFATMMVNNYSMMFFQNSFSIDAMSNMYFATHTHATPWLIGFLFGYFLHLNKGKKFQLSWISVWSGWILCLAMIFTSIFALYPSTQSNTPPLTTLEESFYYTLTRVGWPLALCWVVFACMQGYGGMANSFLSSPLWQPLSRLSYSIYMWHLFIQEMNAKSSRTNSYFSDYQLMLQFWSDIGITLVVAYLLYLIIEAPIGGLDNFLRPQKKPAGVQKTSSYPIQIVSDQKVHGDGPSKLKETETIAQTISE
ncbi:nose resistant to fluoxetine protein 6-like [Drosophila serrata]|uniref:nose resistant to fluoxetine protein 6-like n=1 Tax=Drosophila serrata TaxID=7274 RepID=UPI000A1CF3BE|nr:nose resistant to fluoxetine protein 6-like [Drosophila serrata]